MLTIIGYAVLFLTLAYIIPYSLEQWDEYNTYRKEMDKIESNPKYR